MGGYRHSKMILSASLRVRAITYFLVALLILPQGFFLVIVYWMGCFP